tara:strand:+ start:4901 stop:5647 length:747 start_codon:yes stop_codon:yes gene_type:complete
MDKVSVIIPTYNRFKYLVHAIKSVKEQTYKNIEIIVVNDCSTQKEYYAFDFNKNFGENFYIIHLPKHSKQIFGKICGGGNARNIGMMLSSGFYIAFLDDDDYFMPTKIEKQIKAMKEIHCSISCTEAFGGISLYNSNKQYNRWHYKGMHWNTLVSIFASNNKENLLNDMYKNNINIWGEEEINIHNCTCGGSSIIMEKNLIKSCGYFPLRGHAEDWDYWKEIIKYSKCVFLREPLTYIDLNSGGGKNY